MNSPLVLAVIAAVASVGAGAGVWTLLTIGATKRKLIAEAESVNAGTAALLSQSARDMLADANAARAELSAAREQVAELRQAVAELTSLMSRWRAAILSPTATLDRLRLMVTTEERNGRT